MITYSIIYFLCGLSGLKICAHNSLFYLSTAYLAYNLYKAFLLVTSINSISHYPQARLYAVYAKCGSLSSQYLPTTLLS